MTQASETNPEAILTILKIHEHQWRNGLSCLKTKVFFREFRYINCMEDL